MVAHIKYTEIYFSQKEEKNHVFYLQHVPEWVVEYIHKLLYTKNKNTIKAKY